MAGKIQGTIAAVSESGNLISDISSEKLDGVPTGDSVVVRCDDHETTGIFNAEHVQPVATLIAVLGGSGHLELEIVGDSAKMMLGVVVGEKIEVEW